MKKLIKRSFPRYAIAGTASFLLDYGILVLLFHALHWPVYVAASLGYTAGVIFNFVINKYWTFKPKEGKKQTGKQAVLYAVLLGANLLVTNVVIGMLNNKGAGPELGKLIVTVLITAWNYVLYRKVIFPKKPEDK